MATYRLTIEYEGTRYSGWQEQRNARTVAGELRRAIGSTAGPVSDLGGAGRTDAGVHAVAQAAHLRLARAVDPEELRRKANDLLPADIHIVAASAAPERFHARHDAVLRSYTYQISRRRTALAKRFVWWVKRPLDFGALGAAAGAVAGRHDFALLCERPDEQKSTEVLVHAVEVAESGDLILVRLVASHFLWKLVRRVVGTLVKVGAGELSADRFGRLVAGYPLEGGASPAEWTAPPSGLFLERVLYDGDPPLGPLLPLVPVGTPPASAGRAGGSGRRR